MGGPIHCACSRASAVDGYQIIARSACVLAPRQSYGSTGTRFLVVTPTLNTASARAALTAARRINDSARSLILRAPRPELTCRNTPIRTPNKAATRSEPSRTGSSDHEAPLHYELEKLPAGEAPCGKRLLLALFHRKRGRKVRFASSADYTQPRGHRERRLRDNQHGSSGRLCLRKPWK